MGDLLQQAFSRVASTVLFVLALPLLLVCGVLLLVVMRDTGPWSLAGLAVLFISALLLAAMALASATRSARAVTERLARPVLELTARVPTMGEGDGRPPDAGYAGIKEIDELRRAFDRRGKELTHAIAQQREIAGDTSHQLRTPLTALLMRLDEISMSDDIDGIHEEAELAIAQVERLTEVIDDLLGRSRKRGLHDHPVVSLDTVLAGLKAEWQPAFEAARRSVRVTGERGLMVEAAQGELAQIISTLMENALAHGGGTVTMEAQRSGPSVVLQVSDEGAGVDPSVAPDIFARSVSGGGSSGLGLSIARDLAESNGGRLELVSAYPATFALFVSEARDSRLHR